MPSRTRGARLVQASRNTHRGAQQKPTLANPHRPAKLVPPVKRSDPAEAGPRFVVSAPEARPRGLDAPQAPGTPAYAPEGAALGCHAGGACGPPSVGTSEGYTSLPWIA